MTEDRDTILICRARTPHDALAGKLPLALGVVSKGPDGWRFMPFTSAHKRGRVGRATWERALPRWTGGLDGTESIRMRQGETVTDACRRIAERTATNA